MLKQNTSFYTPAGAPGSGFVFLHLGTKTINKQIINCPISMQMSIYLRGIVST